MQNEKKWAAQKACRVKGHPSGFSSCSNKKIEIEETAVVSKVACLHTKVICCFVEANRSHVAASSFPQAPACKSEQNCLREMLVKPPPQQLVITLSKQKPKSSSFQKPQLEF
jgi:hypothetical protein